jgi:signal transduction histidine kinase
MILIVDDTPENLFALKSLLELYNYEADTASTGEEALRKVLKNEYTLIILDVQMPGMDGYEVAESITGIKKTKDIPILFLSAVNIDKRFIAKGYESGGVDYITKPFDNDLLLMKVKIFQKIYEQQRDLKMIEEVLRREIEIRKHIQEELERSNLQLEEKVLSRTEDLIQTNAFLERRNEELTQYAYLASHDLQEPLRKIITFSELVAEKYLQNNREAQNLMEKVIGASQRMRKLINDLLSYSGLNNKPTHEETDLNTVVHEVLNDLELPIKERNAKITVDGLPVVYAAHSEMRQLFQNLLSNALKFSSTRETPLIQVGYSKVEKEFSESLSTTPATYFKISVQDNGIGLDPQYRKKVFEIFQRLHPKTAYEGTGIGLAIVKKIVEKYNGEVHADGKEGEGAVFTVSFPCTLIVQP